MHITGCLVYSPLFSTAMLQVDSSVQRPLLVSKPDIVVSTPARALLHLQARSLNLRESLEVLVIDEADLIFSHGYESDVKDLLR